MSSRTILLAPSLASGRGTGHLRRSLEIGRRTRHTAILLTGLGEDETLLPPQGEIENCPLETDFQTDCVVVADRYRTDLTILRSLSDRGPVIGIDEGGPARPYMAYLIDTLPGPLTGANRSGLRYLDLPDRRRHSVTVPPRSILVSFGGEDRVGLTLPVLRCLVRSGLFEPTRLTAVIGSHFSDNVVPEGVAVLREPKRLADHLGDYDLVITSFGLTCFEALAAGVPVALVSPSGYHRRLTRSAGLPDLGLRKIEIGRLRRLLGQPERLREPVARIAEERAGDPVSIAQILDDMVINEYGCPVCGQGVDRVLARFPDRTYFRCHRCAIAYMTRFTAQPIHYDDAYFAEEYRTQYGRTYIEDFPTIKALGFGRLGRIDQALGPKHSLSGARVLDVGCAYGPFLAAAAEKGALVKGIEISQTAALWVRENLRHPVWTGAFEEFPDDETYDVVTMWYVIEHFRRLQPALRQASRNLRVGGVLAFSTPNARGISGRRDISRFLQRSPQDHYTVWDPASAAAVLSRFGFRIVDVHVTGHHPERFAWGEKLRQGSLAWRLTGALSRGFGLGDTFEVYARKEREANG